MRNFFALFLLLLIACNNDDAEAGLVGTWTAVSSQRSNCDDASNDAEGALECTDQTCEQVIFTDSSTFIITRTEMGASLSESGDLTISGDMLSVCEDDDGEIICFEYTFALSENTLFLTSSEEDTGCTLRTEYAREVAN